ncbi:DUF5701 family protein [Cellulomonas sp. PhB150]|uniref:DUF5701 family protein n=1 Tax=Cellulomonas sp. PhB150 TaxID=2485188 RepID=UPI000FB92A1B|nr:DUF5701 family protein [Cellulomonas sp. PhB150]ROS23923.1 hypothetical protein EDF34_2986 [Cellulomonas sp. PhB150]
MGVPLTVVDPALPTAAAPPSPAATAFDATAGAVAELERQVTAYVELGVPALLGLDGPGFRALVAPVSQVVAALDPTPAATQADDAVAFVLVVPGIDANDLAPAMRRGAKLGVSVIDRDEAPTYLPLPDLEVPTGPYLLWGIDTGSEFCNVRPEDALRTVVGRGRVPLTIDEGVALAVVRPDMLRPNRCFSLMGSRTGTNQRVPAVWISERRAKLGWCWDRNPHTWLGAASATGRRTA